VHDDRRFLGQMVGLLEDVFTDRRLGHDGLNETRAVTHLQKVNLAAGAAACQPALERDGLALKLRDVLDPNVHGGVLPAPAGSLCERERLRQVFKYPLKAGARANARRRTSSCR
jgi:hypothetical protein